PPSGGCPSKLCAVLAVSRRLRLDENLPLVTSDLRASPETARLRLFIRLVLLCALRVTPIAGTEGAWAQANDAALQIEAKIPLGDVRGRIDHMAADIDRRRLFVAELGNNTVGIVDVGQAKILQVLGGLKEPQGVGYLPSTDTLYVANGGDGSLRLFQGPNYVAKGRIDFGNDADNIRVDQSR